MNIKKTATFFGIFLAVVSVTMFVSYRFSDSVVNRNIEQIVYDEILDEPEVKEVEMRRPALCPALGDGDPGDASGLNYFMVYPHQSNPTNVYDTNLSNASAYEFSDLGNATCTGETPYSTAFDLVWKVQVTNEDGYWTDNQSRNPDYNWLLATCADLGISADTNCSEYFIANNTELAFYHYYLNNSGSGYTISEGDYFNITSSKFYVQRIQ